MADRTTRVPVASAGASGVCRQARSLTYHHRAVQFSCGGTPIKKYRHPLEKRLLPWCESKGYTFLKQIDVDQLRIFRGTWEDGALYASKNVERLRAFFRFCHRAGWIPTNPALAVKPPQVHGRPTLPFSDEEVKRILAACDRYRGKGARVKAFVFPMRYSGLRIGDTVALRRDRLKDCKLLLYTAKTGTPVYIPLPSTVVDALNGIDTAHRRYFWTGKGKPVTAVAHWQRALQSVFKLADVNGAHSHRFRDTSAVSLLEKGVSIETLAMLLGHSDIRVTLRHYRPWVKSLQAYLESEVQKAWTADAADVGSSAASPSRLAQRPILQSRHVCRYGYSGDEYASRAAGERF